MSRPRRVSDEDILATVRKAVLEEGPHVSLDLVADRLGVTAPALFRRFGSRNGLMIAALKPDENPAFIKELDAGPDDRPIHIQLAEVFEHIGRYIDGAFPCMSALRESGIPIDVHRDFQEPPPLRILTALASWLERARTQGLVAFANTECTAMAMLGAIQAPVFVRHLSKRTDRWDTSQFSHQLTRLMLDGLSVSSATDGFLKASHPSPIPSAVKADVLKQTTGRHKEP